MFHPLSRSCLLGQMALLDGQSPWRRCMGHPPVSLKVSPNLMLTLSRRRMPLVWSWLVVLTTKGQLSCWSTARVMLSLLWTSLRRLRSVSRPMMCESHHSRMPRVRFPLQCEIPMCSHSISSMTLVYYKRIMLFTHVSTTVCFNNWCFSVRPFSPY